MVKKKKRHKEVRIPRKIFVALGKVLTSVVNNELLQTRNTRILTEGSKATNRVTQVHKTQST